MSAKADSGTLHRRSDDFGKVPNELMHDLKLTDGAVRLYAHMHWRWGGNQDNHESLGKMATFMGVSKTTITKRIEELEANDWVVTVERGIKEKSGNYQTPHYHVFEIQEDCRNFRETYQPKEGERIVPKPVARVRKSRKGIGGNPDLSNSSLTGDPSNSGLMGASNSSLTGPSNSSFINPDSGDPDSGDPENSDSSSGSVTLKQPTNDIDMARVFVAYESNIGLLTPMLRDEFIDALETYPVQWIIDAIGVAVKANVRNWRFTLGVLKKWAVQGRTDVQAASSLPNTAPSADFASPEEIADAFALFDDTLKAVS